MHIIKPKKTLTLCESAESLIRTYRTYCGHPVRPMTQVPLRLLNLFLIHFVFLRIMKSEIIRFNFKSSCLIILNAIVQRTTRTLIRV